MSQNEFDQAIRELKYNLRRYRRIIVVVAVAFLGLLAVESMFYKVEADEEGVVLRFGKLVKRSTPGLHFKLPWPVETVQQVPVTRVLTLEFGYRTIEAGRRTTYAAPNESTKDVARMLTGDLNLAHVEWTVQYTINDAAKFLFTIGGTDDPRGAVEDTITDVSETVMRRLVGDVSVDDILTTGRDRIANDAEREVQEFLDTFDCGISIDEVKLQTVSPPEPVKDAFDAVNRAKQIKERVVNDAKGNRNRLIPEARGNRDRSIAEAEGYADRIISATTGEANAFLSRLAEYKKAPDVTRRRLYLEAMEEVLAEVDDITIIDESVRGILPLLDLSKSNTGARGKGGAK